MTIDPSEAARDAGVRYVTDERPGIRRLRAGRGFRYVDPDGAPVRDPATLERIRGIAIPPAWTDVWICPTPSGHLQATGRDARRRKQYRYHPRWRESRDAGKYERLIAFAEVLPRIRRRVSADLRRQGIPREKVLALVVRLLELTLIRVGNDEYARLNRSFGLTTLRDRHVRVGRSAIRFRFRGKSGRQHEVGLRDRRLARLISRCQELPGQELFAYVDEEGATRDVTSDDVNAYLREASGLDITAKDFRTWAGTLLAHRALRSLEPGETPTAARRNVVAAIRGIADQLGNTIAVARQSYVHPAVLEAYMDGDLGGALVAAAEETPRPPHPPTRAEERAVVRLLRQRLADERRQAGARRRPRRDEARSAPRVR